MGYSADIIDWQGETEFVIPNARRQELYDAMLVVESSSSAGTFSNGGHDPHISWCGKVDSYGIERVHEILSDYGYTIDVDDEGNISLHGWGGDKLGSSSDAMEEALAAFAPACTWIWCGEDGSQWATRFDGAGHVQTLEVKSTIVEPE